MAAIWSFNLCSFKDFLKAARVSVSNLASAVGLNLAGGLLIRPLLVAMGVTPGLPGWVVWSRGGLGPCCGDRPAIQSMTLPCLSGDLITLGALANGSITSAWGCLILILMFGKFILISGIGGLTGPARASKSWPWSHSMWTLSCDDPVWPEELPSSISGIPAKESTNDAASSISPCSEPCKDAGSISAIIGSFLILDSSDFTFSDFSASAKLLSINFWYCSDILSNIPHLLIYFMSVITCWSSYSALSLTAGSALWINSFILSNLRIDLEDCLSSISSLTWQYCLSNSLSSSDISRLSINLSISGSRAGAPFSWGSTSSFAGGSRIGGSGSSYLGLLGRWSLLSSLPPGGGGVWPLLPTSAPGGGVWAELASLPGGLGGPESPESVLIVVVLSVSISDKISASLLIPKSSRNLESIIGSIISSALISPLKGLQCFTATCLVWKGRMSPRCINRKTFGSR